MIHLIRLIVLIITIIYINIFSCGQNAFGAYANSNSTSDSEFIHIIMWVALAIDGFIYLSRLFEQDDGNSRTGLLINAALSLIYFVAFIILLVSWIKCPKGKTLFCQGQYACWVHVLPMMSSWILMILYMYPDARDILQRFHSF